MDTAELPWNCVTVDIILTIKCTAVDGHPENKVPDKNKKIPFL